MSEQKVQAENLSKKELSRANEFLQANPLAPYGPNKVVREMARRIMALDSRKVPLKPLEAGHAAQLSISTDLNIFADELWVWVVVKDGKRHFNWMPGRRGIIRHANEQAERMGTSWEASEPEPLTLEEKEMYMIKKDAIAVRVKVSSKEAMTEWRETFKVAAEELGAKEAVKLIGKPPGSSGIGVLTKGEIAKLPYNNKMPHINRAAKRALTEALKNKFNLQYGVAQAGPASDDMEGYIHDDQVIDVDWEDISTPAGISEEDHNEKNRRDPRSWGGLPTKIVKAELARDAFVAAELLAHTPLRPKGIKDQEDLVFKLFENAKKYFKEDEDRSLKELAKMAYAELFPSKHDPEEAPLPGEPESNFIPVEGEEPKKFELNETEKVAYRQMIDEYTPYAPLTAINWEPAFKYIEGSDNKNGITRKEFRAMVRDQCDGDVRVGMMKVLGYL